jgi:hypothetical protein
VLICIDIGLNGNMGAKDFRICPCFFYWNIEDIFGDKWHVAQSMPTSMSMGNLKEDIYVMGNLKVRSI